MFVLVIFISLTFYLDAYTSDFQHNLEFVFFFDEIFFVLSPVKFLGCPLLHLSTSRMTVSREFVLYYSWAVFLLVVCLFVF